MQIFSNWIDQGGIQGNPSEEYPIPEFPEGSAIGDPDFIDTHNAGEDWYYAHSRSVGYALISFPISGHLDNHVQYIKYPEWK